MYFIWRVQEHSVLSNCTISFYGQGCISPNSWRLVFRYHLFLTLQKILHLCMCITSEHVWAYLCEISFKGWSQGPLFICCKLLKSFSKNMHSRIRGLLPLFYQTGLLTPCPAGRGQCHSHFVFLVCPFSADCLSMFFLNLSIEFLDFKNGFTILGFTSSDIFGKYLSNFVL